MLYTTISIIHVINLGRVQSATNNFAKCNYFGDALFGQKLMQKKFQGFRLRCISPYHKCIARTFQFKIIEKRKCQLCVRSSNLYVQCRHQPKVHINRYPKPIKGPPCIKLSLYDSLNILTALSILGQFLPLVNMRHSLVSLILVLFFFTINSRFTLLLETRK